MNVSPVYHGAPAESRTPVEDRTYAALEELGIPFDRVDHDPAEDMADSKNAGVLFLDGDKVRVRTFGEPKEYDLSGKNDLPAVLEKLIVTLRDKYGYLDN